MFILSLQLLLASCSPENRMHLSCLYLFIFALFSPIHPSSACNRCLTHTHTTVLDDHQIANSFKFALIVNQIQDCTGERGLCFVLSSNDSHRNNDPGECPHYLETSEPSRTNLRSSTMATVMKKLLYTKMEQMFGRVSCSASKVCMDFISTLRWQNE